MTENVMNTDSSLESNQSNNMEDDNKYIKLDNTEPFQVLVVKPNIIEGRDWNNPSYLKNLLQDNFCTYTSIHPSDYIEKIATMLEIHKYAYPEIKVHLIAESSDYIQEIMYIDLISDYKTENNKNEFATLLSIDGDIIYGNAIVTRTHIPSNINYKPNMNDIVYEMMYDNINSDIMEKMLHSRANTKVIIFDGDTESYNEVEVFGPLDVFAEKFFGEAMYSYKKIELGFLKHNLNIWYSTNKYGYLDVFGNLLPELDRVDKMIVFTMWTEHYRGNLTLDEFNKIKYLSKKINIDYNIPLELTEESKDKINRTIIKNKYRILNIIYSKYNNKL